MNRMIVAPALKGREHKQAHQSADAVIGALGGEERPVRAVVKYDERPHQEAGGGNRQR